MSHKSTPRVTSTDYANPYRPPPVALFNRVGSWLRYGRKPMVAEELMAAAIKKAGYSDFGGVGFVEPLRIELQSIHREAQLTPLGYLVTRGRIVDALACRLRANALVKKHPEILDEQINAPVFVIGLQRTGTTMLQRLVAADDRFRPLRSWETLAPIPVEGWDGRGRDPRIAMALKAEKGAAYIAPDFFAIHPIEAELPEEEVVLLDHAFLSTVPESMLHVPSYAAWLEDADQTAGYEYLKFLLKILQWQHRSERWILKTPHHLEWLDTLLHVFPDAKFIHTHRDPKVTTASFCSMIAHGRGMFSDHVDPHVVGAQWSRKVVRMMDRAMESRERMPPDATIDVSYYDLMSDPMAQVERIYDFLDMPLTEAARASMDAARNVQRKDRHGKHEYALHYFGLTEEDIDGRFARYRERFDVPHEPRRT